MNTREHACAECFWRTANETLWRSPTSLVLLAHYRERHDAMNSPSVNPDALAWIESYARCELSLEQLCGNVRNLMGERFIHNPMMRMVNLNQVCPTRAVRITPQHLEILFSKRKRGEITERQMIDWAHMVTINDAYFWLPEDADIVARWVNFLIFDMRSKD
jgi:hypothetical protein